MLEDFKDHPRVQKRMVIARQMLSERSIEVQSIPIKAEGFEKAFIVALLGDWVTLELARMYHGTPSAQTPIIAEFKKRMAQ
jgi:hypothetical protein